jgi:hypothetical protein
MEPTLHGIALAALVALATSAAPAEEPQAWVLHFGDGGLTEVSLLTEGGKVTAGFATRPDVFDVWKVDLAGLTLRDGALSGALPLAQSLEYGLKSDAQAPKPMTLTVELSATDSRIHGTVTGATSARGKATDTTPAYGRLMPASTAGEMRVEINIPSLLFSGKEDVLSVALFRLTLRDGRVTAIEALTPISESIGKSRLMAATPLALPAEPRLLDGARLAWKIPVKTPALDGLLELDGLLIGPQAVGTARWTQASGEAATHVFHGRVSRAKASIFQDVAKRTWQPAAKPLPADPKRAALAVKEAQSPYRLPEPGGSAFPSTRPIHLGNLKCLYAPCLEFSEVAGAVRYRLSVRRGQASDKGIRADPAAKEVWSFETDQPWRPLTPIWEKIPAGPLVVSAVGLDAGGEELGPAMLAEKTYRYVGGDPLEEGHWKARASQVKADGRTYPARAEIGLRKMPSFAGPYWEPERTPMAAALAAARCLRDGVDRGLHYRNLLPIGRMITSGDGGYGYDATGYALACARIAQWTDDPVERLESLHLAERIAWRVFLTHRGSMPTVYKGVIPEVQVFTDAYQAVFEAGQDARFRDAALDLARAGMGLQKSSGGFNKIRVREAKDQIWPGGVFGPSEFKENGAEVMLRLFGELRTRYGAQDFATAEEKCRSWTVAHSLPSMMWQNVGHHSLEMILIQDTMPSFATDYAIWLLDLAPAQQRNLAQAIEVLRWSEERVVDWSRTEEGAGTTPFCAGYGRAAGSGPKYAGRLAYGFARLYQETDEPLWKAKAEGILQGLMAAQDPVTGLITPAGTRETAGVNRHDLMTAAEALATVPKLLAK